MHLEEVGAVEQDLHDVVGPGPATGFAILHLLVLDVDHVPLADRHCCLRWSWTTWAAALSLVTARVFILSIILALVSS